MIRTVSATRYVAPLREGGSLPGIVEADDLGTYVCKFRGAGQGLKVLVAEVVVGELARRLGIAHPRPGRRRARPRRSARYEADEEVQDLLTASIGLNLGVDFLPGSFGYDAGCTPDPDGRGLGAVARRADRERRPQLAQPEPAGLARRPVGDRPRRLPVLPPRLVRRRRLRRAVRPPALRRLRPRARRATAPGVPAADAALAPLVTRDLLADVLAAGARRVAGAGARAPRRPTLLRAAYVDVPARPGQRRARPGSRSRAPHERRGWASSTSCCAACRAWTARSSSTSAWCSTARQADFLEARCHVDRDRLAALAPDVDVDAVCSALAAIEAVCRGDESAGAAGRAAMGTRFGFVKAPRSTVVQPGPVHGGITDDPAAELDHLLDRLVR